MADEVPDWMKEEEARASSQASTGKSVNTKAKGGAKVKVTRVHKAFQVESERAQKWDMLVAQMKNSADKKTGPELADEALDLLFKKYKQG